MFDPVEYPRVVEATDSAGAPPVADQAQPGQIGHTTSSDGRADRNIAAADITATGMAASDISATGIADRADASSRGTGSAVAGLVAGPDPFDDTAMFEALARQFALAELAGTSEATRLDAVATLGRVISFAQVAQAHLLARLDADGTTDTRFGMRTTSWVAAQTGTSRGPVAGRLRVGRALRSHFDQIDTAVSDGTLSFDHAKALVDTANPRTTDALAAAQAEIIALADGATFDTWRNDVTALAEVADTDGAEPDPYENLSLKMPTTMDRTVHLDGTLDHAAGAVFRQAINTKADEIFRRLTRDAGLTPDLAVPGRATIRALALMELIREAVGAEPGSGSAPRAEVTLVLHNHEVCDTDGVPLPQADADVWGCDPDLWAVMVDKMGIPVDVGHTHRLATIAQRRAIAIRDGGCTFPGCTAPISWCDHHHVDDWYLGGPTDMDNLVALCRHHHGVTHRNGWKMWLDDEQIPHWQTPSGDHLTGQRHGRQQPPISDPPAANRPAPRNHRPRPRTEQSGPRDGEAALQAARARLRARMLARC